MYNELKVQSHLLYSYFDLYLKTLYSTTHDKIIKTIEQKMKYFILQKVDNQLSYEETSITLEEGMRNFLAAFTTLLNGNVKFDYVKMTLLFIENKKIKFDYLYLGGFRI